MEFEPWVSSPKPICYLGLEIRTKYEILELIGQGAFGEVRRGRRKADGLMVAVKHSFHPRSACREVEALRRLDHPNTIKLLEYFVDGSDFFLILEYVPFNLCEVIECFRDLLGEGEIKGLVVQILRAVAACHSASILHRDLKPTNLLVANDGSVRIADFGQARKVGSSLEVAGSGVESKEIFQDNTISPDIVEDNFKKECLPKLDVLKRHISVSNDEYGEEIHVSKEGSLLEDGGKFLQESAYCRDRRSKVKVDHHSRSTNGWVNECSFQNSCFVNKNIQNADSILVSTNEDTINHEADRRAHMKTNFDLILRDQSRTLEGCLSSDVRANVGNPYEDSAHPKNVVHGHYRANASFPSNEHFLTENHLNVMSKANSISVPCLEVRQNLSCDQAGNDVVLGCEEVFWENTTGLTKSRNFNGSESVQLNKFLCHGYNDGPLITSLVKQEIVSESRLRMRGSNGNIAFVSSGPLREKEEEMKAFSLEDEHVLNLPARHISDRCDMAAEAFVTSFVTKNDPKSKQEILNDHDHCTPQNQRGRSRHVRIIQSDKFTLLESDGFMKRQEIGKTTVGKSVAAASNEAPDIRPKIEGFRTELSKIELDRNTRWETQNTVDPMENFTSSNRSDRRRESFTDSEEEWGVAEPGDDDFSVELGNEAKCYDCGNVFNGNKYSSWFGDSKPISEEYIVRKVPDEFEISERYCELSSDGSFLGNKSGKNRLRMISIPRVHRGFVESDNIGSHDVEEVDLEYDRLSSQETQFSSDNQHLRKSVVLKEDGTTGYFATRGINCSVTKPYVQFDDKEGPESYGFHMQWKANEFYGIDNEKVQDGVHFLYESPAYIIEEEEAPTITVFNRNFISNEDVSSQNTAPTFSKQLNCHSSFLDHEPTIRNEKEFQDLTRNVCSSNKPFSASQASNVTEDGHLDLTGCVGTRWYKAPELLYGCKTYGFGVDIWAVGCILGELLAGQPLFPGGTDIDQLSRVVKTLGLPSEENWPGVSRLPDYNKILFDENCTPLGIKEILPNVSEASLKFLLKLLVYDPEKRLSAEEALRDDYFLQDPLPVFPESFPALTKRHAPQQESWHEWKEPCSSSSEFEVVDFVF